MLHLQGPYLLNGYAYHTKAERDRKMAAKEEKRAKEADEAHNASKAKEKRVIASGVKAMIRQAEGANGNTAGSDGSDANQDDSDDEADGDLDSKGDGGGGTDHAHGPDNDNARSLLAKLRRSTLADGIGLPGVSEGDNGVAGAPEDPSDGGAGGLKRAPSSLSRLKKQTSVAGRASSMFTKARHSK